MTGNIALDIFIGLVFVYLLYSLLAAVIMEIINTWMNIRGKNLKHVIYTMLNDDITGKKEKVSSGKALYYSIAGKGYSQKRDGLAELFYNSPGIKYMGKMWFGKRQPPASISAKQFSNGLLSVLTGRAANQKERAEVLNSFFNDNENDTEPKRRSTRAASCNGLEYMKFLFAQASGDLDRFQINLEEWYEEMMLVATARYKQRSQIWLFGIGLVLACIFNVNTLHITSTLATDERAREQMIELSSAYLANVDSLGSTEDLNADGLFDYYKEIHSEAGKTANVLSTTYYYPDKVQVISNTLTQKEFILVEDSVTSYKKLDNGCFVLFQQPEGMPQINVGKYVDYGNETESKNGSMIPFLWWKYLLLYQVPGWIITALAISLGAPFWFDLLNKFMQLRGAISQKKATSLAKTQSKTPQTIKG